MLRTLFAALAVTLASALALAPAAAATPSIPSVSVAASSAEHALRPCHLWEPPWECHHHHHHHGDFDDD
jgi:hypothetical protein